LEERTEGEVRREEDEGEVFQRSKKTARSPEVRAGGRDSEMMEFMRRWKEEMMGQDGGEDGRKGGGENEGDNGEVGGNEEERGGMVDEGEGKTREKSRGIGKEMGRGIENRRRGGSKGSG